MYLVPQIQKIRFGYPYYCKRGCPCQGFKDGLNYKEGSMKKDDMTMIIRWLCCCTMIIATLIHGQTQPVLKGVKQLLIHLFVYLFIKIDIEIVILEFSYVCYLTASTKITIVICYLAISSYIIRFFSRPVHICIFFSKTSYHRFRVIG